MFVWHRPLQGHGHWRPASSNLPQDRAGVRALWVSWHRRPRSSSLGERTRPRASQRGSAARGCGPRRGAVVLWK